MLVSKKYNVVKIVIYCSYYVHISVNFVDYILLYICIFFSIAVLYAVVRHYLVCDIVYVTPQIPIVWRRSGNTLWLYTNHILV